MKTFTLYWKTGDIEIIKGNSTSIAEAMTKAGYSNGAVNALDFFGEGTPTYKWDTTKKEFVKLTPFEIYQTKNKKDNRAEIMYRARCILGMRGLKNFQNISLNISPTLRTREIGKINFGQMTNEELAKFAIEVAEETLYWM